MNRIFSPPINDFLDLDRPVSEAAQPLHRGEKICGLVESVEPAEDGCLLVTLRKAHPCPVCGHECDGPIRAYLPRELTAELHVGQQIEVLRIGDEHPVRRLD